MVPPRYSSAPRSQRALSLGARFARGSTLLLCPEDGILTPGGGHSITLFPSFLNRQEWKTAFVFPMLPRPRDLTFESLGHPALEKAGNVPLVDVLCKAPQCHALSVSCGVSSQSFCTFGESASF